MKEFKRGLVDGIPIGLGYLSVSVTFGIMAVNSGLPIWQAVLISMTNLTSAGQFAGITVIGKDSTIPEGARIGRNVLIASGRSDKDFPEDGVVGDGQTI